MSKFPGFPGFRAPECTQVPDLVFDRFLPDLSGAELKVLLYIIRRTYGFSKTNDNISLAQLQHGITKHNGEVLDRGTGLSKTALLRALETLEEKTLIIKEKRSSEVKGYEPTNYRLRMAPGAESEQGLYQKVDKGSAENGTRLVPKSGQGLYQKVDIQDPVLQDTDNKKEIRTTRKKGLPFVAPLPSGDNGTEGDPTALWSAVLLDLQRQLTRTNYRSWLEGTTLLEAGGQVALIAVPSQAHADWLSTRAEAMLKRSLEKASGGRDTEWQLRFEVD